MITYTPAGSTIRDFHQNNQRHRVLIGPFGSGKSVSCCVEIFKRALEQQPNAQNIRKSRWAIIRNTYVELRDTTLNSWKDWWGNLGRLSEHPPFRHRIKLLLSDQTTAEIEVLFLAMDRPDQAKKLLSLELTGAWVNEAREVPQAVFKNLLGRCGRYPNKRDGGATWYGVIADTNPPDTDHWIHHYYSQENLTGWKFFHQPAGVIKDPISQEWVKNPHAENLSNLPESYYIDQISGNTDDWISVHLGSQFGFIQDGERPVFPEFKMDHHVQEITYTPDLPLFFGMDFGLTPALVIGQQTPTGHAFILEEIVTEDMATNEFCTLLHQHLKERYARAKLGYIYGDPAGNIRAQTDLRTPFQILRSHGFKAVPAHNNNDWNLRKEAVRYALNTEIDGRPLLTFSPKATTLCRGLAGQYHFKRHQIAGEARYRDIADKNDYSHICDALQYFCLGAGFGQLSLRHKSKKEAYKTYHADSAYKVF